MAYNYAHDVDLPGSASKPLVYFMYPQAETSEGRVDPFDPENVKYEITVKRSASCCLAPCFQGAIQAGQTLALEPCGCLVRVRGMQIHGRPEEHADVGCRIALNLSGIEVSEVSRGQTLVEQQTLNAVTTIDVEATLLPGCPGLKHRSMVHFHAFTSDALATVFLYGYDTMLPGERRLIRIKLGKPVVLLPGDRFVLRQASPATTIGGGQVLNVHPLPNLRKARCLAWLKALQDSSLEQQLLLRVARCGIAGLEERRLMAETGLTQEAPQRLTVTSLGPAVCFEFQAESCLRGNISNPHPRASSVA
jgi:selenocysteine-specific elongation factor